MLPSPKKSIRASKRRAKLSLESIHQKNRRASHSPYPGPRSAGHPHSSGQLAMQANPRHSRQSCCARVSATALPMPLAAPVTMAIRLLIFLLSGKLDFIRVWENGCKWLIRQTPEIAYISMTNVNSDYSQYIPF